MHLEVVTPQKTAVSSEVDEVTVPGVAGEFGVLPGHTPFITALKQGTLSYRAKGGAATTLAIGPGYCEVDGKDKVVVLTQSAEKA
jgi:F-type H+-transporting ATPase subunit epsilon